MSILEFALEDIPRTIFLSMFTVGVVLTVYSDVRKFLTKRQLKKFRIVVRSDVCPKAAHTFLNRLRDDTELAEAILTVDNVVLDKCLGKGDDTYYIDAEADTTEIIKFIRSH